MLSLLKSKPELAQVIPVLGGCDRIEDRHLFRNSQFDLIVSRQVTNGLLDPLTAFRNWYDWLVPGGTVIVIDGFYGRDAWTGAWQEEIDVLPLSACQSLATVPYLLESTGFQIEAVAMMEATNRMPATRTKRYIVVATVVH
jgi:SAM-dependent methyltransferase